uniref:Uncharacterized protein n=1 Tax=Meloidogyne javanica TaxID=6303 RepID=A0A915LEP1_MELJA
MNYKTMENKHTNNKEFENKVKESKHLFENKINEASYDSTKFLDINKFKCPNGKYYQKEVGNGLAGTSCLAGYKFDGPVERATVKAIRFVDSRGKVTDCDSHMQYYEGGKRGACYPSPGNNSTYCGKNSVCKEKKP